MYSALNRGAYQKNVGQIFIYWNGNGKYDFYCRKSDYKLILSMDRTFNIWNPQLKIWLIAKGLYKV